MILLIPGRHHILSDFQFKYLFRLIQAGLLQEPDAEGRALGLSQTIDTLVWAVTSANHQGTRRNPWPLAHRCMMIQEFCRDLDVKSLVFGIDDLGQRRDFGEFCLKKIHHESEGRLDLTPENTLVALSTPVAQLYADLGFRILPLEKTPGREDFQAPLAWTWVQKIAQHPGDWTQDPDIIAGIHPACYHFYKNYHLGDKLRRIFTDPMIGEDGDLTASRDYRTYVAQMDAMGLQKYQETAPFILPGRIGDIGCAVGTWIKCASEDPRFQESDFYGIEVARPLVEICRQRAAAGEFTNPFVFFAQKNAVSGLVFERGSMDTIHTSSLTHEIESYGGRADLLQFLKNRYEELKPGGRWINRDVVGPPDPHRIIYLDIFSGDGGLEETPKDVPDASGLKAHLETLSTLGRFFRFVRDFRPGDPAVNRDFQVTQTGLWTRMKLTLGLACEFASRKDYTDNWQSEMHETFTFWSLEDWKTQLETQGFKIHPSSHAYTNPWIVEHRWAPVLKFYQDPEGLIPLDWPVTTLLLVAEKPWTPEENRLN